MGLLSCHHMVMMAHRVFAKPVDLFKVEQRTAYQKEGDLILLEKDDAPRSHWPLGKVLKTFPGDDRRVRVLLMFVN